MKFEGQLIVGKILSVMTTLNEQETVFPDASVTLKVLVVVPTENEDPLAIPERSTVVAPEQLSTPTGEV